MADQYDKLASMDNNALDGMVNMMKSNPAAMKAQYEQNSGMKLSDD